MFFRKKEITKTEDNRSSEIAVEEEEGKIVNTRSLTVVNNNEKVKYTGRIISMHDGFSYIGQIKRGYETINTNGDVFVPQELPVGAIVEFEELNTDPKRPGKFRAESAAEIKDVLVEVGTEEGAIALKTLSQRSIYHIGAKEISPEETQKAAENLPFAEMLGIYKEAKKELGRDISEMAREFLQATFANLHSIGVSYSVEGDVDEGAEKSKVDSALTKYRENGLDGQVKSVEEEYRHFVGIRQSFTLMYVNGILGLETVIPIKYLPDLLVTAPVWFVASNERLQDLTENNDPLPDHAVRFFCDQVSTKEFAWLYQIYNRRTRPLKQFSGRDIIPLPLMKVMEQAIKVFDYTVIATPYHDIASKEWVDPNWLRNLDPFLFGFMKNLPYMFLLGRWSGTGLFPLMCEMIADTIDHLRVNCEKLKNFHRSSYWYKGNGSMPDANHVLLGEEGENEVLIQFAQEVIRAFEEGRLFEFLRGEKVAVAE